MIDDACDATQPFFEEQFSTKLIKKIPLVRKSVSEFEQQALSCDSPELTTSTLVQKDSRSNESSVNHIKPLKTDFESLVEQSQQLLGLDEVIATRKNATPHGCVHRVRKIGRLTTDSSSEEDQCIKSNQENKNVGTINEIKGSSKQNSINCDGSSFSCIMAASPNYTPTMKTQSTVLGAQPESSSDSCRNTSVTSAISALFKGATSCSDMDGGRMPPRVDRMIDHIPLEHDDGFLKPPALDSTKRRNTLQIRSTVQDAILRTERQLQERTVQRPAQQNSLSPQLAQMASNGSVSPLFESTSFPPVEVSSSSPVNPKRQRLPSVDPLPLLKRQCTSEDRLVGGEASVRDAVSPLCLSQNFERKSVFLCYSFLVWLAFSQTRFFPRSHTLSFTKL